MLNIFVIVKFLKTSIIHEIKNYLRSYIRWKFFNDFNYQFMQYSYILIFMYEWATDSKNKRKLAAHSDLRLCYLIIFNYEFPL